ncbi:MAG: hypothetical protein P1V81_18035 [Planctomycetota bacterium]|nr:hypothetical protein [Planctomycetota bacterium]
MRLGLLLTALAAGLAPPVSQEEETFELAPRKVEWATMARDHFDLDWRLPSRRTDGGADLERDLRGLLAAELQLRPKAPVDAAPLTSFAALAQHLGTLPTAERVAALDDLLETDPATAERYGGYLRQLLLDGTLFGDDWDPEDDADDDGLLRGTGWELPKTKAPWTGVGVDAVAEQGAVFVRADLFSFKEAENDYSVYDQDVAADYESIGPVRGSLVVGDDPAGRPFASYRVQFECDLPFPFGGYDCDLRVLNRMTRSGELVAHIYSESEDFHWIAGRDRFLSVRSAPDAAPLGYLVVRVYGFDLAGVPDGRDHRRTALRSSLGNLKRKAEARFAETGPRDVPGELPVPPLRGRL